MPHVDCRSCQCHRKRSGVEPGIGYLPCMWEWFNELVWVCKAHPFNYSSNMWTRAYSHKWLPNSSKTSTRQPNVQREIKIKRRKPLEKYRIQFNRIHQRYRKRNDSLRGWNRLKETQQKLGAGTGFEPMTSGLWARRATRLLHPASRNNSIP